MTGAWKKGPPTHCKTCGASIIAIRSPQTGKWTPFDYLDNKIGKRHCCHLTPEQRRPLALGEKE